MSSRKKSILIYLGGIITGIILTFAFFFFVALGNTNGTPSDNNVVMFESHSKKLMSIPLRLCKYFQMGVHWQR